jgi:hypothetical protein
MKSSNAFFGARPATRLCAAAGLAAGMVLSGPALARHPGPQPRPGPSQQTLSADGTTTYVVTPEGHFPSQDPFADPPGSNFLLTVYSNMFDSQGNEMPNTLPSTPDGRYNLHDGPVLTQPIDPASPTRDLAEVIQRIKENGAYGRIDHGAVQRGLDILEGNPIPGKAYSGFPMLHYNGPNKVKVVEPIYDSQGNLVGGNVDVNMIYFDQHLESDTAFVDPSAVQEVPWTITYHLNILHRGIEDFSPMAMHFDLNEDGSRGPFHISMDQSFFPMLKEGTRYTIKIKESLGKYYNLTYVWGWRIHPPRVQVIENALKVAGGKTLPQHEIDVFGPTPNASNQDKLAAIAMIGELSPAKRMWLVLRQLYKRGPCGRSHRRRGPEAPCGAPYEPTNGNGNAYGRGNSARLKRAAEQLEAAFLDWQDRTKLPAGVEPDPDAVLTLLYVNNTLYGSRQGKTGEGSGQGPASYKGISNGSALDWSRRPYVYDVTLYNGDHYPHGYMNVDFGGSRGWENQFQFTDPTTAFNPAGPHTGPTVIHGRATTIVDDNIVVAGEENIFPINRGGTEEFLQPTPRVPDINADPQIGSGCYFTFGRNHAWPNAGGPWGAIIVPPVGTNGKPGMHKVEITYNFEPSRRLRIYQFDPLHHDVAVYSLH